MPVKRTMSKLSRSAALELIANWSTAEVIQVLKRNNLGECCQAVLKRQIDGDELLHLTTGKLALWKSDLTRDQIWTLWNFVESMVRSPEDYIDLVEALSHVNVGSEDVMSDSGGWGSDFDDYDEPNDVEDNGTLAASERSSNFRNSLALFEQNAKPTFSSGTSIKSPDTPESIYMNCPSDEDDMTYINVEPQRPPTHVLSQVSKIDHSLAEQLNEELTLMVKKDNPPMAKPQLAPRPVIPSMPSKPLLMTTPQLKAITKKPLVPPASSKKFIKTPNRPEELPRPPKMLRNFDLVANLPTRTEESDDDYEAIDGQVALQHQQKIGSTQTMLGSVESVYRPSSSTTSQEKEDDFYECITETLDDHAYVQPISARSVSTVPPPLPAKHSTPEASTSMRHKTLPNERSPEKKGALHHSCSNSSLLEMRATRPLPPPPDRLTYADQPWFHTVTREQANALIKERPHNGFFLLRPSNTNPNNPFVLTLWFNDGVYNVQVRKRPDNRYALGSPRAQEQSFTSVEEIVQFHSREELPLCRGRVQTGSTLLLDTPPK